MSETAAQQIEAAITGRRAIRGFLPDPVSRATVEHLLDVSARFSRGRADAHSQAARTADVHS